MFVVQRNMRAALIGAYGVVHLKSLQGDPIIRFEVDVDGISKLSLKTIEAHFAFLNNAIVMNRTNPTSKSWARELEDLDKELEHCMSGKTVLRARHGFCLNQNKRLTHLQ